MLRWLPEDVSPYGAGIDSLFYFIYYLTAVAFIVVTALMLIFLYVYRDQGGRRATYTHGNTALEIIWTIIPAIIFIALGLASTSLWEDIKLTPPETDTVVKVTGKQFNWEIVYPGPDGEFDTADDKQVDNDIRVPAGKPIRVLLHSKDVIHSFFLPNLRFKQDTVPGREITGWFQANKPGRYEIPCAELCGFGHSGMVGWLYALAPDEYQAWQNEQWPQVASSNGAAATNGSAETAATETASSAESASSAAAGAAGAAQEAVESSQEVATEVATEAATDSAQEAMEAIQTAQDAADSATGAAQDAATEAVQDATDAAATVQETAGEATQAAQDTAQSATDTAQDTAESAAEAAQDAATDASQDAPSTAQDAAQSATEAAGDAAARTTGEAIEVTEGAATDATHGATEAVQDMATQAAEGEASETTSETGEAAQETTAASSPAVAASLAAVSTAIGSATQEGGDTASAVQETIEATIETTGEAVETTEQTPKTATAQIPSPATDIQAAQEASAEGSSSEASTSASDQESSADASSQQAKVDTSDEASESHDTQSTDTTAPDATAPDSRPKYAFTPAAEPGGTCQGELEIVSGATIYELAQEFYAETKILLGVDLIPDYNPHITNLDNIYPGQKLCIPTLSQATRLRRSAEGGPYNLILDSFRSTRKAKALIRQVKQKGYKALLTDRQVSDSLLLKRVEITGLQDQTTANQAWAVFAPANTEDLS